MDKISTNPYLIRLTLIATLGGLLFGYDTAVISGTVSSLKIMFIDPFGWPETTANFMHGLVVSSALIGCIIGGLSGGIISLKFGRKTGLIMAAALVRPDKKLAGVEAKSVKKRFKETGFAAGASRGQIASCDELGLELDEFVELGLEAMRGIAGELGL